MSKNNRPSVQAKGRKHSKVVSFLLGLLAFILAACAAGLIAATILTTTWLQNIPDWKNIEDYSKTGITTIYASDRKTELAKVTLVNRIQVTSDNIAQSAKDAIIAVEDERFYEHGAIDPAGLARSVVSTLKGNKQGASTLTMQLVRNTVLLDEMTTQTLERKVREVYIANQIEKQYTKDEILTMYLNVVNFGNNNYGIEAAAQDYFGKSAKDLTLAESSLLVSIPNSPTFYDPRVNYANTIERRTHVLDRMLVNNMITQTEYDEANASRPEIKAASSQIHTSGDIAPYFVDYIKDLLSDKNNGYDIDLTANGGYSIYTTLDVDKQAAAEDAVATVMENSGMDASITSVEPSTGNIVAMVGGRDYNADQFNLSTQMRRQPGSTFKMFTLAMAIEQGVSPETKIEATAPAKVSDEWTVNNCEGENVNGKTTIRNATELSLNTVYARIAHYFGAEPIVQIAHDMGITTPLESVESITLGTQGVNTLEMASAYATLATGGIYHPTVAITDITDVDGKTVYEHQYVEGTRVLSEAVAAEVTDVLKGVITKGTGTGGKLAGGREAAGKTGTSELGRDLWFCGYTPQLSAAVWTGYRDESPSSLYGGTTSTPIWKKYMDAALSGTDVEKFPSVSTKSLGLSTDWDIK